VRSNATAGTSLILGTADPLPLGLAILGSQLPDLDTTQSTIGKIFFPLSSWIEDRFPHRSITHSLLATGGQFPYQILDADSKLVVQENCGF
jgi:inner membrane protein